MVRRWPASFLAISAATSAVTFGSGCRDGTSGAPDHATSDAAASGDAGAPAPDTGSDRADDDADAAAAGAEGETIEREAAVVFAAPDLPPQFLCFVGFEAASDGSPTGEVLVARGPWGVPDATDPNASAVFGLGALNLPVKLTSGFPYGAIVRLPIRQRDSPFFDQLAGVLFSVSQVGTPVYEGNGVDSATCRSAWGPMGASATARFTTRPGEIRVGESWLVALSGCAHASSDPQCAGGDNLTTTLAPLDLAVPSAYAGAGDTQLAIQVANLAPYAGYQNIDAYFQPMRADPEAGAPTPDGPPLPLGDPGAGLDWTELTPRAAGVQLPSGDQSETRLLIVKHGQEPLCEGHPCGQTVAIPVQPFIDKYAPTTRAGWSGHQVLVLFGRPPLGASEAPASVLRLGVFSAAIGGG